jgi:hypothetical protein
VLLFETLRERTGFANADLVVAIGWVAQRKTQQYQLFTTVFVGFRYLNPNYN